MFHKYIDMNTFDIRNDIFEVDEKIAPTIVLLNKKGYITNFSCAGHYEQNFIKDIVLKTKDGLKLIQEDKQIDFDENEIERLKNEPYGVDILEKEDKYIIYYETLGISTHVNFIKDYNFDYLPEGFEKQPAWDKDNNCWSDTVFNSIHKDLMFYKDNGERKKQDEIEKEIDENNKLLYEWAKKLHKLTE